MTDATLTPAAGVGTAAISDRAILGIPRSLYIYENIGLQAIAVLARSLYAYENIGLQAIAVLARAHYLYENAGIQALVVLARSLYVYEATRDGEVFPWLMRIDPIEQYRGGTVDLYGDGFGEILEAAAGATITADSTSGGNIPGNTVSRTTGVWLSTANQTNAWIRYTFGSAKTITAIALESAGVGWGVPQFRFSDGGANVNGGAGVPLGVAGLTEYPVGSTRTLYTLPAARTTTYVEIRVAGGGATTGIGLGETWIFEDLDAAAEGSSAILNDGLISETGLGTVVWANRSPGLYPANGGLPITPAATATIPPDAVSGLVVVEETI